MSNSYYLPVDTMLHPGRLQPSLPPLSEPHMMHAWPLVKERMTDRVRKTFYLRRLSHAQTIQCPQQIT